MMTRMSIGREGRATTAGTVLLLAALLPWPAGGLLASPAANDADGSRGAYAGESTELLPVDVVVRIVNGTTRQDGFANSVALLEAGPTRQTITSASEVTGRVVLPGLVLDETRSYIVQAVNGNIPYLAQTTGHDLAAGPITVYVFETTTDRAGVTVSELNLCLKRTETDLQLEYLITITNEVQPQRTVLPDPTSFELLLPDGAVGAAFEMLSGAAPQKMAAVAGQGPGRSGLAVPLRSGTTRLRVTTSLPYDGRAHLAFAANLPVAKLNLLVLPVDLRVDGDFTDAGRDEATGCERWQAGAIDADRELRWTVSGGSSPRIASRADDGAAPRTPAGKLAQVKRTGLSLIGWLVVIAAVAMVALALARRARRAGRDPGRQRPRTRGPRGDI